mgnify:CR=1 FL=1
MTGTDAADFVPLAERLAAASGDVIRPFYRAGVAVDDKADDSPVTVADREAEAAMRAVLARDVPEHGILGEEYGPERTDAEWVWVLDPVDGTKGFITGLPTFGTLIALCRHGRPVLGIIDQPVSGDRWVGCEGRTTTLNGHVVHTRACPDAGRATLLATSPEMFRGADAAPWQRLEQAVKMRRFSADCLAYGVLAAGFVDLVAEADLQPYDYCAHVPVVEGAGGRITDWQGHPLTMHSDGRVLAAGDPALHAAALALLA